MNDEKTQLQGNDHALMSKLSCFILHSSSLLQPFRRLIKQLLRFMIIKRGAVEPARSFQLARELVLFICGAIQRILPRAALAPRALHVTSMGILGPMKILLRLQPGLRAG